MHLSSLERYEIQAEAFRRMTGHLAPGKDAAAGTYDEAANRTEIYARWAELHGECVYAVLDAVDYVLRTGDDESGESLEDRADVVSKALRRAWQLGQTYWQQADSEYTSHHKKADETQAKFQTLVDETRAAILADLTPNASGNQTARQGRSG